MTHSSRSVYLNFVGLIKVGGLSVYIQKFDSAKKHSGHIPPGTSAIFECFQGVNKCNIE